VKKKQLLVAGAGLLILVVFYFFGNTVPPLKKSDMAAGSQEPAKTLDIKAILDASKSKLSSSQLAYVNRLENSVVRGDVKNQQITSYRLLSEFWKDSVQNAFLPSVYYLSEAAKLENSEKSLTFAAQLFLSNLRGQDNLALRTWMADQSRDLFERAEKLNPANDSTIIGLGATYIFGSSGQNPTDVMKGIQKVLEVARRDSLNLYAQLVLGLGGIESGQYDKAIPRLLIVAEHDPSNLEAILSLGEAYERTGDNPAARKWYGIAKKQTNNPDLVAAIDERLESLK
jgi:tetratricopeptide (TPR) repeat protein